MPWLNLTMPNQTVKNGLKDKNIKSPQMNFFLKKQLIKFSCTYWPLSFCKILKKFLGPIQSYKDVPFLGPKWPICYEQNLFVQTIFITFIYLLALFITQNLKKFFQQISRMHNFWAQNGPFPQIRIFFQKTYQSALFLSFMFIYMPQIKIRY